MQILCGHSNLLWPMSCAAGTPRQVVLPKEKGLEREAASWYTRMYPRTQAPGWPSARPVDIIQVLIPTLCLEFYLCGALRQNHQKSCISLILNVNVRYSALRNDGGIGDAEVTAG